MYLESISQLSNVSFNFKNVIDSILSKEGKNITLSNSLKGVILNEDFYVELEAFNANILDITNSVPLLVLEDSIGREVINRSLIRVRRIRIDRNRKTVQTGVCGLRNTFL